MRRQRRPQDRPNIPIAPMIDCVFLMLVYFMVTSSLDREEADLGFQLPGRVEQVDSVNFPDEQWIELDDLGQVTVNDYRYDTPESPQFLNLAAMLKAFADACSDAKVEAMITIAPSPQTPHQAIIKVMDAAARASLSQVHFALEEEAY
jgi:biopolymer transport protein ExbD